MVCAKRCGQEPVQTVAKECGTKSNVFSLTRCLVLRIVLERRRTLPTFAEAKEEFKFWLELCKDNLRDWPKSMLQIQARPGARCSCLLILETSEQKKFELNLTSWASVRPLMHQPIEQIIEMRFFLQWWCLWPLRKTPALACRDPALWWEKKALRGWATALRVLKCIRRSRKNISRIAKADQGTYPAYQCRNKKTCEEPVSYWAWWSLKVYSTGSRKNIPRNCKESAANLPNILEIKKHLQENLWELGPGRCGVYPKEAEEYIEGWLQVLFTNSGERPTEMTPE